MLGPDLNQEPLLARLRLPAPARVLAREPVDVLVRALCRQLRSAADGDPAIAVLVVDDEHGHARVTLEVARLRAAGRGVEEDVLARPTAVLNVTTPSSASTQTIVLCGEPSGRSVVTLPT